MPPISLIIIGAGPAGYECAVRAAKRGVQVTLIEEKSVGGVCLREGCIPTKCLCRTAELLDEINAAASFGICLPEGTPRVDLAQAVGRKDGVVASLMQGVSALLKHPNIRLVEGRAQFAPDGGGKTVIVNGERLTADYVIIATGSRPRPLPIPGADLGGVVTSTELLSETTLPESLAIIGGGVIGVEFATFYSHLGCQVTLVEGMANLLPQLDRERGQNLAQLLNKQGVEVLTSAMVQSLEPAEGGLCVHLRQKDKDVAVTGEKVLCAIGRRAYFDGLFAPEMMPALNGKRLLVDENYQTSIPGVYAIGDCVFGKAQLAHTASAMGEVAAENIMGIPAVYDEKTNPTCVYMEPEAASVGLTEEQAKAKGIDYVVGKFPMSANGKALILNGGEGLVKIIAGKEFGEILGMHIIGPRATDLICEGALAIEGEMTLDEIIATIHSHPTVTETMREAALQAEKRAIHTKN
mgnify:CR=1 FL=1